MVVRNRCLRGIETGKGRGSGEIGGTGEGRGEEYLACWWGGGAGEGEKLARR